MGCIWMLWKESGKLVALPGLLCVNVALVASMVWSAWSGAVWNQLRRKLHSFLCLQRYSKMPAVAVGQQVLWVSGRFRTGGRFGGNVSVDHRGATRARAKRATQDSGGSFGTDRRAEQGSG